MIVASIAESTASMRVLRSAVNASVELKSSTYHFIEKLSKTVVLALELNEKNIRTAIGANRKMRINAI